MSKGLFAAGLGIALALVATAQAYEAPLGGFIPYVGIGLTNEYKTGETLDPNDLLFNSAVASNHYGGSGLGKGASVYFDVAIMDTGAATHILTQTAADPNHFAILAEGFRGVKQQVLFGPTGNQVQLRINDPLGVYVGGLKPGSRTSASGAAALTMATGQMKGQTSVAMLEGDANWALPNIIGLPMAAQHGVVIRNDQPQIFQYQNRTMRTPQVELIDLGSGNLQGITRRTDLRLNPSASFIGGPVYLNDILQFEHPAEDPASPTVVEGGGLYVDVDLTNEGSTENNVEFLFDTGADMTVMSEVMAASLGFDLAEDQPDFFLEVEGGGGIQSGVPGFYLDQLKIDCVGGSLIVEHVPVAVLDSPNPADPSNVIDAILGMHIFTGRNLVIDASPAAKGAFPKLYISDPVSQAHTWSTAAASADWAAGASWNSPTGPEIMWSARVLNVSGGNQSAVVSANSMVYDLKVAGTPTAKMSVNVQTGATLTTYGETRIDEGGEIHLNGGKLDAPFVNIFGGALTGHGPIFVGSGGLDGTVRNFGGRIAPDGEIDITGDLSNAEGGTIAIDLFSGGNDLIDVSRSAFLKGSLEVSLTGFVPVLNQVFTILEYGTSVDVNFDQVLFPAGFQWNLFENQLANTLELKVTAIGDTPGDFNHDGSVNGQDLALWESGYGQPGGYSGADFLDWQRNHSPGPLAAATNVPEPTAGGLIGLAAALAAVGARSRR